MIRQDFSNPLGFPFDVTILEDMQRAYEIFNVFGELVGDYAIIKGCDLIGASTTDGYVYVNGELFEFRGGLTQSKVIIKQEITSLPFESGDENDVLFERYVTFGTGTTAIDWSLFSKQDTIKKIVENLSNKEDKTVVNEVSNKVKALEEFVSELGLVTHSKDGFMSSVDKIRLDNLKSPTNIGWFNGVDVGSSAGSTGTSFNVSGDVLSAKTADTVEENSIIEVTVKNNMSSNYYVRIHVESEGDVLKDNNIGAVIFKKVSSTKFLISTDELPNSGDKNLKIHIETITIN